MRTVMEYYQKKVGKLADLRDIGETNRTTLVGDNTILELNFMGDLKYPVPKINILPPSDPIHDGGIVYIMDNNVVFYKLFKNNPIYMVYDILEKNIEFLKVDKMISRQPYKTHPGSTGKTTVTNCICDGVLFAIESALNYKVNVSCTRYQYLAEDTLKRFISQNINGSDKHISRTAADRSLIDSNISLFIKWMSFLDSTEYYRMLLKMRKSYYDEKIPVKDIENIMQDKTNSYIIKNKRYICNVIMLAMKLKDMVRHIFFSKYNGTAEYVGRASTKDEFTSVRCTMQLSMQYYKLEREDILKELNRRQDDVLRYARLIMGTDPAISKVKKKIKLVNIIISNDSIELVYVRTDLDEGIYEE